MKLRRRAGIFRNIPQFCKPESEEKFFFDIYDVEEGVL